MFSSSLSTFDKIIIISLLLLMCGMRKMGSGGLHSSLTYVSQNIYNLLGHKDDVMGLYFLNEKSKA